MQMFQPDTRNKTHRNRRLYALYEVAYTVVDFAAALTFLVGSIFFFYDELMTAGTWLFVIGSVLFGLKPTLRVARELHYLWIGDYDDLAKRS
ncbi:YrhK family protein [Mangrovibrevibacter kandeliae]|uniref:YrhK family protein n=1 Tax=Mangrovibrevibacter kandeliae TaxID=2968473 RepID=UPI002117F8D1|nr:MULTISPECIES: YrhK family protein [unclassified Aurantimonas]MCQ8783191.1 YrhK family protein [Aurantimonas sp. CSK15Z-1]MCW4115563.1 YrhK family protein [Aurantimonas sp. MSK8Z-1]